MAMQFRNRANMKHKVVLIDDEPIAHQVLLHHLKKYPNFEIVAQCYSAVEALQVLANQDIDLLFLDINMPALTGIEMLKVVKQCPSVIIVSAHPEYAIDGFELNVVDYLLKPVNETRFAQAIDKLSFASTSLSAATSLTLKVGRSLERVTLTDITYLESYGNYVKVWVKDNMILANTTLKSLIDELPKENFVQINKSTVINLTHIHSVTSKDVTLIDGQTKKVSKLFIDDTKVLLKSS